MPEKVLIAMAIESMLIAATTLLLVQPGFVVRVPSDRARAWMTATGLAFLCATFCWSVVFGCVLALNSLTMRI
jgi:hypothetical protein